ncbi:MAG: AraC family transcriptional regulator, partial [Hyphomicrobium sp.]
MADSDVETNELPQIGFSGEQNSPAYEFWREEFCRRLIAADLAPIGPGPVRHSVTPVLLPRVRMAGGGGTPMRYTNLGTDGDEALALVLAASAPMHMVMNDRTHDLAPTDICLADSTIEGGQISQLTEGSFNTILVNRKTLLTLCPNAEDLVGRPLHVSPEIKSLLFLYSDLVLRHPPGRNALAQNAVAQHLIDLVTLCLGSGRDETELAKGGGLAASRFEAMKADILARLGDGNLSLGQIAQRHRASPRYVQMLFERAGMTFSEFVLEQRLLYAHRLLASPLNRARKV